MTRISPTCGIKRDWNYDPRQFVFGYHGYPWPFTLQIEWDAAACSFNTPKWLCMNRTHYLNRTHYYDVVGNVYDNPEKLK